jgi:hypothetical protein
MKKYALIIIAVACIGIPFMANAQSPLDKFFEKYAGQDGYTTVNISKDMFQMFAGMGDPKDTSNREMKKALEQLSGMKVLTCKVDSLKPAKANAFYNEASALFPASSYKELMTVNDDGQNIRFLTKQDGGNKISEMVMLMKGKQEVVVLGLQGTIDLSTISKISKSMNIHGMENLQKMKDKHQH